MAGRAGIGGRPRSVAIAVTLMTVVAVGYLADAIWVVAGAAAYPDRVRAALDASAVDPAAFDALKSLISALPYVAAATTAVAALVLLGMAASVRAGHFAGRIVAWVAIGLSVTCSLCGLSQAGTPAFSGVAYVSAFSRDGSGTHTFAQRLPQAYPPAYRYISGGFAVFAMLALILVVVLLALPSANRFFRPAGRLAPGPAYYYGHPAPAPAPPADAAHLTAEHKAHLSVLIRQHQRGELTDEEFAAARRQLTGDT
jgi:hypothetical protein